jgi:hypothetical protein
MPKFTGEWKFNMSKREVIAWVDIFREWISVDDAYSRQPLTAKYVRD